MGQASEPPPTSFEQTAPSGPPAEEADLTGKTLGDFLILRRLGVGGMGQVYLAEQISLKRKVALKLLRADLAANATSLARFQEEAKSVARATHANIVQVYWSGEVGGLYCMALEYVEGRNLRQFVEKKGPPDVLLALSIIRQVAAALQRASELGIVHRDIKPENILLTRKGEVKVADFGLSRCFADNTQPLNLTQTGVSMGTPLYMSPEQVEGKPVDPRTDIYSFGVTCYHLLAGQPPFRGQSAFEVAVQHVQKEPAPLAEIRPDLPPELCVIVHKMMAKRPEDRYQSGREIARDVARLRDTLAGVTSAQPVPALISTGPTTAGEELDAAVTQKVRRLTPRRPWKWAAALSVLLALLGGLGYGWWRNTAPPPPPPAPPQNGPDDVLTISAREKFLLEAVKQHTTPTEDSHKRRGLEDRIELGLIYLKERRLKEADHYFKQLEQADAFKPYALVGQLGQAMTLAFQDRPKESMDMFRKALAPKKPFDKEYKEYFRWVKFMTALASLREVIAEALHFNLVNEPTLSVPPYLDILRRPPLGPPPKKGKG